MIAFERDRWNLGNVERLRVCSMAESEVDKSWWYVKNDEIKRREDRAVE